MTIAPALLAWYDRHARKLPWRVGPKRAGARHAARSLPRLAVGDHAAADDGRSGEVVFRCLPLPLAGRGGAGRRAARGGDEGLGRARLLRARPQPPRLCDRRHARSRRALPGDRGRAQVPAGDRRLHRGGDRGDRLRRGRRGDRRQYRAGGRAPFRHRHAAACGQEGDPRAPAGDDAGTPAPATMPRR